MSDDTITIDADDFIRAAEALEGAGFDRQAGRIVASALRKSGNSVRRHVRERLKPHRQTGKLARAVRQDVRGYGMDTAVTVRSGGPVAHLVSGGVRAHDIDPGRIMAMHGPGRAKPLIGFAQAVHHPGFRGDPYFAKGIRDAQGDIQGYLSDAADDLVGALMRRRR